MMESRPSRFNGSSTSSWPSPNRITRATSSPTRATRRRLRSPASGSARIAAQLTGRSRKELYERALALDPNYADAERNLAILHDLYLDNPSAALPHFERYQLLTQGADTQVTAWVAELKARIAAVTRTAEATP